MNEAMEIGSQLKFGKEQDCQSFLILKGALLLALSSDNAAEAEALYQQAVLMPGKCMRPMLELRAAMRLSRLWHEQGKKEASPKITKRGLFKNNRRLHNGRPEGSQMPFWPIYRHEAKS